MDSLKHVLAIFRVEVSILQKQFPLIIYYLASSFTFSIPYPPSPTHPHTHTPYTHSPFNCSAEWIVV